MKSLTIILLVSVALSACGEADKKTPAVQETAQKPQAEKPKTIDDVYGQMSKSRSVK